MSFKNGFIQKYMYYKHGNFPSSGVMHFLNAKKKECPFFTLLMLQNLNTTQKLKSLRLTSI